MVTPWLFLGWEIVRVTLQLFKNWAHISNDFAKNFCSTSTFACWVKSDLRTLYSGISFSMWSDGRHRATPSSVCCVRLRGFVSTFALLKMLGRGKCVFNSDWVLDSAYKDWYLFVNCYSLGEISKFTTFHFWFSLNQNAFHIRGSNFWCLNTP